MMRKGLDIEMNTYCSVFPHPNSVSIQPFACILPLDGTEDGLGLELWRGWGP